MTNNKKSTKGDANQTNFKKDVATLMPAKLKAPHLKPISATPKNIAKISTKFHHMTPNEAQQVIEKLQADQVELELQNEELRRAQLYLDTTRARYFDLYELAPVGYCTINSKGIIIQANPFISTLLGLSRRELSSQSISRFLFQDDVTIFYLLQKKLIETAETQSVQLRLLKADGIPTWVKLTITGEKRGAEEQLFHLTLVDIQEHKKAEENLRLASSVFTHTREGILVTDAQGNIIDVNAAFTRITQFSREEVLGKNPRILQSGHQNSAFYETMWNNLIKKGYWHGEMWNRRKNGELYAEMKSINAVYDEHNNLINYVSLFKDITEKKLHQTYLEHIAHFDALTNLPNRSLLIDRLRQALTQAQRRKEIFAVVFIDLDGFKAINDQHGHDAGDQLLITLASRMRQALREGDTLSRLGGDEFVALLLDLPDVEACLPMLSRLLQAASQPVQFNEKSLQVSASLGITYYPQGSEKDADQLLHQADQAMYYAKLAGKNRYHIFDVEQSEHMHGQHESVTDLETALNKNEFILHYQPKVNMRTAKVIGVEASIFWKRSGCGQLITPDKFLPTIKNHSFSIAIDEWILHSVLIQIEDWLREDFIMPISVNISIFYLQQANFVQRLSSILSQHPNVDPHYLELEVTETNATEDLEHIYRVIKECRELGVNFALDHFGTGYSSISYLRRLPISLLKIDLSFTHYMLESSDALLILEGAISLAHAFHLNIIAEGVNSIESGTMLLRLGCDLGQGNSIATPMEAKALPKWVNNWKIDPAWVDIPIASHDDFLLILATVENKGWCRSIENYITGMSETNPIQGKTQLQLGIWLNGVGLKKYGNHPLFSKISYIYRQFNIVAKKLCDDKDHGNNNDGHPNLNLLYSINEELSEQVNTLLLEVGWSDTGADGKGG